MGCASSKIDDLPAVVLCRHRLTFLEQTLHQRFTLSEAHVAYVHSLDSLGLSFHRYFDSSTATAVAASSSPFLNLPTDRKVAVGSSSGHISDSESGSHLEFESDSDEDEVKDKDKDKDKVHHLYDHDHHHGDDSESDGDGPLHLHDEGYMTQQQPPPYVFNPMQYNEDDNVFNRYPGLGGGGGGYMHMNYMKKHVTPSVTYQQKPFSSETVQFGGETEPSSSYNHSNYPFYPPNQYPSNNYGNPHGYMNYGPGPGPGPGPGVGWGGIGVASTSKPTPPPPPPPPANSGWDFLNLFESIDHNSDYPPYTPSRDSSEVRQEEGIPDLEDEEYQHEVVKQVDGSRKLVDEISSNSVGISGDRKSDAKKVEEEEDVGPSDGVNAMYKGRLSSENSPVEYEVHMVDKKVVDEERKAEPPSKGGKAGFTTVFEVVREIQVQFERASASAHEVDKVLEVGKLRYHRKNAYQVSRKMLNVITPSLPSTFKDSEASLEPDEDVQLRSVNLSASLQKLYLWEKKLFEEVKAEEKMRVLHDRKVQKLKRLDERGADPQKVEATTSIIRNLSTKIRIAIQIVDKISVKINKVRDEELWPQLNELIQGLSRMWRSMLECHHSQYQAIDGARGLDAIAFQVNTSDTQLEASLQLEHDLINWTCRFSEWIDAQKGFVQALNSWLFKCLLYEPEVTADGVAPFSPGRAGAPPVFVICNQWNQSLERISETSEKEVVDSMRIFAMMVWHLRERDKGEMRQRMSANREIERKVKNIEREDLKMQKEIQAMDKMAISSGGGDGLSLSGRVVYQSETSSKSGSFQASLMRIFEAMDRFSADSLQVYEELLQRIEEVVREQSKVS